MANRTQRSLWPIVLIVAGFVLVAAAGLVVVNLRQPATPVPGPEALTELPFPAVQRVSLEDARQALDAGTAVFVDVRDRGSYEQAHIPGALSIPLDEIATRQDELDPEDWIITYCTWPAEETSARAAFFLLDSGFSNATPIQGGFGAWRAAGYSVEP